MYVYDTRELERQSENFRNACLRHCKIGKLRHKGVLPPWALEDIYARPARPKRETFFIDALPWASNPNIAFTNA